MNGVSNQAPFLPMAKDLSDPNKTGTVSRQHLEAGPLAEKGASPAETARYIAEFAAELSYLAREAQLDLLAYLLDMARLEATRVTEQAEGEA